MNDNKDENSQDIDVELTGEDNVDAPDLETVEEAEGNKLKALRDKLKAAEKEKMEALEQLQRTKAEFLNARKRLENDTQTTKDRAVDDLIRKVLPLHDSFTAAMQADTWQQVDANWRKGVEAIYAQLSTLLQSYQVAEVNPMGQEFDPEHHEAMGYEPVTEADKHDTVVQVLQVGFTRDNGSEHTIRPARVIVGNFQAAD